MSWENDHYSAICKNCEQQEERIVSSDDWNRQRVSWVNFEPDMGFAKHSQHVARNKTAKHTHGVGECGSMDIEIGELLRRT